MKRNLPIYILIITLTSCISNIRLYLSYTENKINSLDNPILVFHTKDSMFVCTDYLYLHDIIYHEHFSDKYRKYNSFVIACAQGKVELCDYLDQHMANLVLEKEAREDFNSFVNKYCEKRDGVTIIKRDDLDIVKILFERGYYINDDCYWGFYKAVKQ